MVKISKKVFIVLAILLVGCFVGCKNNSTSKDKNSQTPGFDSSLLEGIGGLGGETGDPFDTPITKFD